MPYTPPAGSAVTFNFINVGVYVIPAGNSVVFNFGAVIGGTVNPLPVGVRLAFLQEDDWFVTARRISSIADVSVSQTPFPARPLSQAFFQDDWFFQRRNVFPPADAPVSVINDRLRRSVLRYDFWEDNYASPFARSPIRYIPTRRKPVLFTVT